MAQSALRWPDEEAADASCWRWVDGEAGRPVLPRISTLLNLVQTVQDHASSDDEVVAVILHLLRSGRVKLCGIFGDRPLRGGGDRAAHATPCG